MEKENISKKTIWIGPNVALVDEEPSIQQLKKKMKNYNPKIQIKIFFNK
jgi:hypothetical protein